MSVKSSEANVPSAVRRRRVVHIAGFDPISPEGLVRHMKSGLKRFGAIWSAEASASEPTLSPDGRAMHWEVEAKGSNWITTTRYTVLRWDGLMEPYVEGTWLARVLNGYRALLRLSAEGMIGRYFRANLRYGLFVIYPFLLVVAFLLAAIGAGMLVADADLPLAPIVVPLVAVATFLVLFRLLGAYFHLQFALSDWSFASDLIHGRVAGFEACIERFAEEIRSAGTEDDDEVLFSATSLGAVMLLAALERALAVDPGLCGRPKRFALLTAGSSVLKIGLHPAAGGLRSTVTRIGDETGLFWIEYQAKVDFINFYKNDPVEVLAGKATGRPRIRMVRMRDMMGEAAYRRKKSNLLHVHRQFILPNGKRYFYDFYQICFGPLALADREELGFHAATAFSEDGGFSPRNAAARAAGRAARDKAQLAPRTT